MSKEILYDYDLLKELRSLVKKCTTLKPSTADRKARVLFSKYRGLIAYDSLNLDYYEKRYKRLSRAFTAIKNNRIKIGGGYIKLSHISWFKVSFEYIEVSLKNGKEVKLEKEDYLSLFNDLFDTNFS